MLNMTPALDHLADLAIVSCPALRTLRVSLLRPMENLDPKSLLLIVSILSFCFQITVARLGVTAWHGMSAVSRF